MNKTEKILIGLGLFLMVLSPYLLTRYSGILVFGSNAADVGNAIGGITAPFTALIGAYLLYLTILRMQDQINAMDNHKKVDNFINLFSTINNSLDSLISNSTYEIPEIPYVTNSKPTFLRGFPALAYKFDFGLKLRHVSQDVSNTVDLILSLATLVDELELKKSILSKSSYIIILEVKYSNVLEMVSDSRKRLFDLDSIYLLEKVDKINYLIGKIKKEG